MESVELTDPKSDTGVTLNGEWSQACRQIKRLVLVIFQFGRVFALGNVLVFDGG